MPYTPDFNEAARRGAAIYLENPLYISTTRTTIVCPACNLKKFERTETRCPRCHHPLGIEYFEIVLPGSLESLSPQRVGSIRQGVGSLIRAFRSRRGMTQAALASLTGIHRTYLSRIESGRVLPSIINLLQIARALGVDKVLVRARSPSHRSKSRP
jgi:DNA-binding XRE family transcriptional regulator